ncbi:unnamed protein product [Paramecium octaurelia]|uniref:Uncharacterized protein n=1 Tax=Paramecium octaurelia TaxID=43137 RepID=A0A8S1XB99_PAROT|nr:unnamed protein product [Paramecium octaurelia]
MSKVSDNNQGYDDSPMVAFFEDYGGPDTFFGTLRGIGWRQAAYKQKGEKYASFEEIMRFFIKIYALLIGMVSIFYLMTFLFLFTNWQTLEDYEPVYFNTNLYLGTLVVTILIGVAGYVFHKGRQFPINLILYLVLTAGVGYIFGYPLSMLLQDGYYSGQDWIILLYMYSMSLGCYTCLIIILIRKDYELRLNLMVWSIIGVMIFLLFVFILTAPYYIGLLITTFIFHIIHGFLVVIDTKLIISGKFSLKTNQYLSGAIYLYLDITVMLIYFIGCILYAILKSKTKCVRGCCECLLDE